ncbi:MAB_1171c family putative transporter [Streptomyces sp. NPDC058579]|uniref:MAB_1171c family putative transporter n=1 Tax=Streptomyces sp. NPDC058579 TaxID=3346548 RepID=UPI00364CE7EF
MNLYIPAAALALVLVVKFPYLVKNWRSPVVRSVNTTIFLQAAAFFFAAPPTIVAVNAMTGVSNFSVVLVYCLLCAYACACLVLLQNWREDTRSKPRTHRRVRLYIWCHGGVAILLAGLFALGDAPVERPSDFETYYANSPFIREMVLLCLLTTTTAAALAAAGCWNWARDIHWGGREWRTATGASLRLGLSFLGAGFLTNLTYGVAKFVAIVVVWQGRDGEPINRAGMSFAALGTLLVALGFLIPVAGPWLAERVIGPLRTLRALGPLWRAVRCPADRRTRVRLTTPWYAGPGRRLTDRMTDIHDRTLELLAYCSEELRADACARARAGGATEAESVATGLAAMFKAAAAARALGGPADKEEAAAAARALRAAEAEHRDLLVGVSRAMSAVPAVSPVTAVTPAALVFPVPPVSPVASVSAGTPVTPDTVVTRGPVGGGP